MSAWKKALVYLGLGPDEGYDDYGREPSDADARRPGGERSEPRRQEVSRAPVGPAQPMKAEPRQPSTVRTIRPVAGGGGEGTTMARTTESSAVKAVTAVGARPSVIAPRAFNDAQEIADRFRAHQPVIVNLQGVERDLSRRLIDFASGLCYGLGGQMEKVANHVYMLTPSNVEVSPEERQRLQERGYTD
jgi:cell division inhibitor SepF